MRFGTKVWVERGGFMSLSGPGSRRKVKAVLVGAKGVNRRCKLAQPDSGDTIGIRKRGDIGWWPRSAVTPR
jgi:hypothetical protein